MEWLYLINLALVFISFKWAMDSFDKGLEFAGWLNIFASALNGAVIAHHFI